MPRFHTGWRRSARTVSVVPLRLWIAGSEDSHLAHTLDVSNHGVKLGGCQGEFKVGDKVEVLYRHKHTQARIVWIMACEGSSEKRIGAEFLEPEKQVSGLEFPEQAGEHAEKDRSAGSRGNGETSCNSRVNSRGSPGTPLLSHQIVDVLGSAGRSCLTGLISWLGATRQVPQ
jgi:hypothetical protein